MLLHLLCAACLGGPAAAAPLPASPAALTTDTIVKRHFEVTAQPLHAALEEFALQAGIALKVADAIPADARSAAVAGDFTLPDALRRLLAGSGFRARFGAGQAVLIMREAEHDAPVYNLRPIEVIGARNRGYSAVRTTTATRTDTPLRDTPQSVSVITRDVIADQSMQNMADVLRYVPGATMGQGEGHRDAPTIRGNSTTADFFVDGVRDDVQYFRDLYNVERVETLKGSNAMIFGRGGGGGVVNRVTKAPEWTASRMVTVASGSFGHKRATIDVGQPLTNNVAVRVNGMYEDSEGFRDEVQLERHGVHPTIALALGERTTAVGGYEYFSDERTVDRGIPSFQGRPSSAGLTMFFGNPDSSYAAARMHGGSLVIEHQASDAIMIRNRARVADYHKFYQNSFPGALNAAGDLVSLVAYNNRTSRTNLFNQTDVILHTRAANVQHTLLAGIEVGRQYTENFRQTGYYNNTATSVTANFTQPTSALPITFRQSASDADNETRVTVASLYVQDQLDLSRQWQAIAGIRYERFAVDFHNRRNGQDLSRVDDVVSPRAGLIFKPAAAASLYGSYSVSHLPSTGDQFSSLSATTETLEPERFANYELGGKWDARPNLSLTAAVYRLDRTNTTAPHSSDAQRVVQTGSQRTTGLELSAAGDLTDAWHVVAATALQRARITSTTSAASEGALVPLVPARTFSLWNRYRITPGLGAGLGVVHQSDMYAAIDNSVTLPAFTRMDGALFWRATPGVSVQLNVENLLDTRYYPTSHGNNNIMPGALRTFRLSLTTKY